MRTALLTAMGWWGIACTNDAPAVEVPHDVLAPEVVENDVVVEETAADVAVSEERGIEPEAGIDVQTPIDAHTRPLDGTVPHDAGLPRVVRVTFEESDVEIANPERGFYRVDDEFTAVSDSGLRSIARAGRRLTFAYARLDSYRNAELPAAFLARVDTAFARVRSAGLKVIVRFAYNQPQSETDYRNAQDAPLVRVQAHLRQLAPVISRNADVLAVLQAGFVGAWGEWHTSSNHLTSVSNRTAVRDALLAVLPSTRFIQFRYPGHLMGWYPTVPALADVLAGRAPRVGAHNDCFMASATDVGTYDPPSQAAAQRAYVRALSRVAPFGGETCDPADETGARPRLTCADIRREGPEYALSYLNEEYSETFIRQWRTEGCFAEVARLMGYRFVLRSLAHDEEATRGAPFDVSLTARNVGWARIYNPRPVLLLALTDAGAVAVRLPLDGVDPRTWVPATTEHEARARVMVPATVAAGRYELCLAMPDAAASLAADVRYAVRVANADVAARRQRWDATLGCFRTGTSLTVR